MKVPIIIPEWPSTIQYWISRIHTLQYPPTLVISTLVCIFCTEHSPMSRGHQTIMNYVALQQLEVKLGWYTEKEVGVIHCIRFLSSTILHSCPHSLWPWVHMPDKLTSHIGMWIVYRHSASLYIQLKNAVGSVRGWNFGHRIWTQGFLP
jgi:hypothetical protein